MKLLRTGYNRLSQLKSSSKSSNFESKSGTGGRGGSEGFGDTLESGGFRSLFVVVETDICCKFEEKKVTKKSYVLSINFRIYLKIGGSRKRYIMQCRKKCLLKLGIVPGSRWIVLLFDFVPCWQFQFVGRIRSKMTRESPILRRSETNCSRQQLA